jgi:hypothetical protein
VASLLTAILNAAQFDLPLHIWQLVLTDCCNILRTVTTCRYNSSGQSNFELEYLGEFEAEFENILKYE